MKKMLATILAAAALVTGASAFAVPAQAATVSAVTAEDDIVWVYKSFWFYENPPETVNFDDGYFGYLISVEEVWRGNSLSYYATYQGFYQ